MYPDVPHLMRDRRHHEHPLVRQIETVVMQRRAPCAGKPMELGDFQLVDAAAEALELTGVAIIAVGSAVALLRALLGRLRGSAAATVKTLRLDLTRALLLGLELLVAADIIRTATLESSLEEVAALGLLVLIRTFLTWTILVEEEGRWPWQSRPEAQ
jgi:uncharacterized membrane protein